MKKIILFLTLILGLSFSTDIFAYTDSSYTNYGKYTNFSLLANGDVIDNNNNILLTNIVQVVPIYQDYIFLKSDGTPVGFNPLNETFASKKYKKLYGGYLMYCGLLVDNSSYECYDYSFSTAPVNFSILNDNFKYFSLSSFPGSLYYITSSGVLVGYSFYYDDINSPSYHTSGVYYGSIYPNTSNNDFVSVFYPFVGTTCGIRSDKSVYCFGTENNDYYSYYIQNGIDEVYYYGYGSVFKLSDGGYYYCNASFCKINAFNGLDIIKLGYDGNFMMFYGELSNGQKFIYNIGDKSFSYYTDNNNYSINALNLNSSNSSNSSQTCIYYQPQTFDYVFNREFSVYLKNENDYYISSSERNLSYRNKNNKDLLKINFGDFDYVYHYDNNLDRIFDVNLMYKSQFNGSLKVNNGYFDDNEIEIKVYSSSGGINFFRLKSDQDYDFELLGLSDTKKTKTSIGKFKTNTDYHLSEDFYSLFIKLDGYTFNGYNIYGLTLINYTKKYKSEQKTCYDSDTQKFTIDGKEVNYDIVSNLDETGILNIVKDKNSIFNKKVTQDILNGPSYKQYDTGLNTSVNVDDYFSSCNKDLSNVNIGAFQGFVSLGFGPVKVPLTDIILNFYPFSGLTCPLKSVYYIKNDLFSKF